MGTVKWGILGAAKIAREQVIPAMKKSKNTELYAICLLYTSPSPRDMRRTRMPSSA